MPRCLARIVSPQAFLQSASGLRRWERQFSPHAGWTGVAAGQATIGLFGRTITSLSTVIAFDTASAAVALLSVIAAPVLVTIKIAFALHAKVRLAQI